MDSADLEGLTSTSSYQVDKIFKVINIIVGLLMLFCGFTELVSGVDYFFQGLYVMLVSVLIIHLEFKVPPKLFIFASSFFSFLGRGAIYIMLAILNFHGSFLRVCLGLVVFVVGIIYVGLQFTSVTPPSNMQGETGLADDILEDVI